MERIPSMLFETHTQRILDLVSQRGLLCASDLDDISAPRVILTRKASADDLWCYDQDRRVATVMHTRMETIAHE